MSRVIENPEYDAKIKTYWIRHIVVTLESDEFVSTPITFDLYGGNEFDVEINGKMEVSSLANKGTVAIRNLEYDVIVKIMTGKYYNITIKAGYKSSGTLITYFKGYVYYISQKVHSRHDTTTYIHYASEGVAKWGQTRLTYNYNSGINIYTAIKELENKYKLPDIYISDNVRNYFLKQATAGKDNISNIIESFVDSNNKFIVSASDWQTYISISTLDECETININPNIINIQNGNPRMISIGSVYGISFSIFPVIELKVGNVIKIDNSLIDLSISDAESVLSNLSTNFIDPNGEYLIIEMEYNFCNRSTNYEVTIKAISYTSVVEKVSGIE